jgi:hypothetical protein
MKALEERPPQTVTPAPAESQQQAPKRCLQGRWCTSDHLNLSKSPRRSPHLRIGAGCGPTSSVCRIDSLALRPPSFPISK